MAIDRLEMNGPALLAFLTLLAAAAVVLAGDAVERVIAARRRWGQRERELAALDAYHNLAFRRPPDGDTNTRRDKPSCRRCS